MKLKSLFFLAFLPCVLSLAAQAQTPKPDAKIAEYHLEGKPTGDYPAEGGTSLSITYDDGTHFVEAVPKEPADAGTIPAVFSDVKLADDKQTLGWELLYDNCCQSYPIPLTLILYKDGKIIQRITRENMIYDWQFVDGGKKIATLWGPTHGPGEAYFLYEVVSGKMLEEIDDNFEKQELDANAPGWALNLQAHFKHPEQKLP